MGWQQWRDKMTHSKSMWIAVAVCVAAASLLSAAGLAWAGNMHTTTSLQPDEDAYYVSPAEVSANWSNFHYHFVAGTTLRPRDSSTAWDYTGGGCVSAAAGNDLFNIHLDLPDGARIDYLRIFYRDTSAANSRSWITSYDGAGNLDDIITLTYSDNSGYGTKLSAYSGHIVDTYNRAYVLNWVPYQIGSSMRLCGFRVAYRLPDELLYLPLIIKGS